MSRHNFMLLFTFQFFSSQEFRVVLLTTARYTKNLQLISVPFFSLWICAYILWDCMNYYLIYLTVANNSYLSQVLLAV